jgi:hypothetical protein
MARAASPNDASRLDPRRDGHRTDEKHTAALVWNSLFLEQAGVDNHFIWLPDIGIHGNSHYLMPKKNSMEIAALVADWLARRVTPAEAKAATTGG